MFALRNLPLGRHLLRNIQVRLTSYTVGCKIEEFINTDLEKEVYKPKDHPGKVRFVGPIEIPSRIHKAIERETDENKLAEYIDEGKKLNNYLFSRHVNMEQKEVFAERKKIQRELQAEAKIVKEKSAQKGEIISEETTKQAKKDLSSKVDEIFYKKNYNWKPIEYTELTAWAYLYGRAAKEYAIVSKILSEIAKRDPEFKPRSYFDFGSGVGTGIWAAAQLWEKSIFEYFCVDKCGEMNELSDLILRNIKKDKKMNIFYRQFLPASEQTKYHIVLSAFSLMELENLEARLEVLNTLWKKCDGYLIVIENGTNAGFQLVEEARTFILSQNEFNSEAYIFSPCPHESPCPRVLANDGTPCNFSVCYHQLRIGKLKSSNDEKARFSYVVFKKGSRSDDTTIDWPRLVRPTQVRGRHTRCHLCTHSGELRQIVLTKSKHSKYTYRCAKKSDVGDRLPIIFDQDAFLRPDTEIPDDEKFE